MNIRIFASILLAGTVLATPTFAATIQVSNGGSIQAAINQAGSGDVVLVRPGTYSPFQVTKSGIKVVSVQPGGAHVVASGGRAIESYGQSNIEISNFRISAPSSDGVAIGGSPGNLVSNIKFYGNTVDVAGKDGFKFFQVTNLDMQDNTIRMAGALGRAGQGGNGNGDGGIDWVTVNNSRMVGNTVERTNGWACAMVKTGSNGNLIQDNDFHGCEVNGIDMAAGSSGRAGAANTTGKTAFNNRIEGNEISSGSGCAVKFAENSTNNQVTGNTIRGRTCADPNGTNNQNANVPVGNGTFDRDEGDDGAGRVQLAAATSSIGGSCAGSGALSAAMSAAGSVVSIWNGGKATAPLQIAQQMQLIAQRICLTEQLMAQLKHLQASPLSTAGDIQAVMARLRSLLGATDATVYDQGRAIEVYRDQYPGDMGGMSTEDVINQTDRWRGSAHRAMEESWRIQSGAVQSQAATQARVGRQLGAVQTAPGMLAAQQGTAQLIGSLIGETQAMQSVSISHFRAVEHSMAQQQAKEKRAEELHRRAMKGLGENDTVSVRSPF